MLLKVRRYFCSRCDVFLGGGVYSSPKKISGTIETVTSFTFHHTLPIFFKFGKDVKFVVAEE